MTLLEALRTLRKDGPLRAKAGICGNLVEIYVSRKIAMPFRLYDKMCALFIVWPKFSGCPVFPIPDPDVVHGEKEAFVRAVNAAADREEGAVSPQWDRDNPYGALRLELLDFMITELEKDLEQ